MKTIFEVGKEYKTRNERRARIYSFDGSEPRIIHGAIFFMSGWALHSWKRNGDYDDCLHALDLVPPVETRKPWINVYSSTQSLWDSRQDADDYASPGRIACIEREITFTPGEGLGK